MEGITRKLIYVRRVARWLLLSQRVFQVGLMLCLAALILGPVDYMLRLPVAVRTVIGLALLVALVVWLGTRLIRAARFRPTLSELALRVERLFPELAGRFASAVEFSDRPERYAEPRRTGRLAEASVTDVRTQVERLAVRRLIHPGRALGWGSAAVVGVLGLTAIGFTAPQHARIAAQRWLTPMSSPAWPKRTDVVDTVERKVWALDSPIRMRARVARGFHEDMRVTLRYRFKRAGEPPGPWQQAVMTPQRDDDQRGSRLRFESLVEPSPQLRATSADQADMAATLEYTMQAGDDQTRPRTLKLVPRPEVQKAVAHLTPPDYAKGLIDARQTALHAQTGRVASVSALSATRVRLVLSLNKPIPVPDSPSALLPGLAKQAAQSVRFVTAQDSGEGVAENVTDGDAASDAAAATRDRLVIAFPLKRTLTSQLELIDRHGIRGDGQRDYRFEATEDEVPAISLTEPSVDQQVLAKATVSVAARARDDVGVRWLRLRAAMPEPDSESDQTRSIHELSESAGRQAVMREALALDLSRYELAPGDQVTLTAQARDVYAMNGQRHEPVTSSPRTLTIIDESTLLSQVRDALNTLRQQSVKLKQRQDELTQTSPRAAGSGQRNVTRKLDNQRAQLDSLEARLKRNRIDEPSLDEQLGEGRQLLEQAKRSSQRARQSLSEAQAAKSDDKPKQADQREQQGRQAQKQVSEKLGDLASLLDRGQDAMALKLELEKMTQQQQALAGDTRELLPRTVGRSKDELPDALKQRLQELAKKQRALSEQTQQMVRQMQQTARSLDKSDKVDDKAAAKTMAEAAAIAQRQGLAERMEQASKQAEDNKLSRAGQQQGGAMQTLRQMQGALDQQQQERREMLRRRLQKLAQLLQQLIDTQQRQRQALDKRAAEAVAALAPAANQLRRRTMAAQTHAERNKQTQPAAAPLGEAVAAQGNAVEALRAKNKPPADQAEKQALKHLKTALQRIREAQRQAQQTKQQQKRDKLRQQYQKLAERQRQLRQKTEPLAELEAPNRQQQAKLGDIAETEQQLRKEIEKLRGRVEQTIVFRRMHRQVDQSLGRVIDRLKKGRASEPTVADQRFVTQMLESMAEALKQPERDQEFAQRRGGGGAGGGGSGSGQGSMVPPYAELKLLRAGQAAIHARTQQLAEARDAGSSAAAAQLRELSGRQQALAELGQTLIRRMQRSGGSSSQQPRQQK